MITSKKSRIKEQAKYNNLEDLRAIPVKTLDEQKRFLDIKFKKKAEKKKKWKFTWKGFGKGFWVFVYTGVIYFLLFRFWQHWFLKYSIELKLWQAIIFIIIFPLIINLVLNKFNLTKSDIGVFLRGSRKKKSNEVDKK